MGMSLGGLGNTFIEELASLFSLFREAVDCPRATQWEPLANLRHAEG